MSGSMMGPVGSAQRRVIRSERPLRSIFALAETRETPSTSGTRVGREKAESAIPLTGGNKMPIGREAAGN
jgi:hypothetical protein